MERFELFPFAFDVDDFFGGDGFWCCGGSLFHDDVVAAAIFDFVAVGAFVDIDDVARSTARATI